MMIFFLYKQPDRAGSENTSSCGALPKNFLGSQPPTSNFSSLFAFWEGTHLFLFVSHPRKETKAVHHVGVSDLWSNGVTYPQHQYFDAQPPGGPYLCFHSSMNRSRGHQNPVQPFWVMTTWATFYTRVSLFMYLELFQLPLLPWYLWHIPFWYTLRKWRVAFLKLS